MKKLVHSRWKELDCTMSPSQMSAAGLISSRCRVALERGAFSDVDAPSFMFRIPLEKKREQSREQGHNADAVSRAQAFKGGKSHNETLKSTNTRRRSTDDSGGDPTTTYLRASKTRRMRSDKRSNLSALGQNRPGAAYWELIANVYQSEEKTLMRKSDIIRILKTRYPYFQTMRNVDCRVGEALTRSSKFRLTESGLWEIKDDASTTQNSRSFTRKRRTRRQPDFLRIEWRKSSGYSKKTKSERKPQCEKALVTTSESDCESTKRDTSSSSLLSSEEQAKCSPTKEILDDTASDGDSTQRPKLGCYMEMLRDFNEKILNQTIKNVTMANEKCLQHLMSELKNSLQYSSVVSRKRSENSAKHVLRTVVKRDRKLLKRTIDKIISENEKCLQVLDSTNATCESQQDGSSHLGLTEGAGISQSAVSEVLPGKINTHVKSLPSTPSSRQNEAVQDTVRSTSSHTPVERMKDGSHFPLPTLSSCSANRGKNHIKCGKRVIPKLRAYSPDNAITKSPIENDHEFPRKTFLPSDQMKSKSPTNDVIRKVRLPMDLNFRCSNQAHTPSPSNLGTKAQKNGGDHRKDIIDKSTARPESEAVNDAFAEYARRNSELDDIVAMIDPSMSKNCDNAPKRNGLSKGNDTRHAVSEVSSNPEYSGSLATATEMIKVELEENRPMPKLDNILSAAFKKDELRLCRTAHQEGVVSAPSYVRLQSSTSKVIRGQPLLSYTTSQSLMQNVRPQSQIYVAPHSATGKQRLNVRYVPPYQWSYRAPAVTQNNAQLTSHTPVYIPQGMPRYQVVYSNSNSKTYEHAMTRGIANSSLNHQVGCSNNGVQCRIRGATVVRIPTRK